MRRFSAADYPVYLHTQPGSYRAIKLYSDFGFKLLSGEKFGTRRNSLEESLPILKQFIPEKHFQKLKVSPAPEAFLRALDAETSPQLVNLFEFFATSQSPADFLVVRRKELVKSIPDATFENCFCYPRIKAHAVALIKLCC